MLPPSPRPSPAEGEGVDLGVGVDPVGEVPGVAAGFHLDLPVGSVNGLYHTRTSVLRIIHSPVPRVMRIHTLTITPAFTHW